MHRKDPLGRSRQPDSTRIDYASLAALDLNLFVAFDALMTERHVTRAAARIGVKQAAMSHSLRRLRELFGDELFTRKPGGIEPTPRARELSLSVHDALIQIQRTVLAERSFEPSRQKHAYRLGITAGLEAAMLPPLTARLEKEAPGISLVCVSLAESNEFRALDTGEVDIVVGPPLRASLHHKRRQICAEEHLCCFSSDFFDSPLSLDAFLEAPHVRVSPRADLFDVVDDALVRLKKTRRVVVHTSHALSVPYIVKHSRAIAVLPASAARAAATQFELTVCAAPLTLAKNRVVLTWHASSDADASHRWLRRQLVQTAATLGRTSRSTKISPAG